MSHCPDAEAPVLVYETRDQAVYRPHGLRAAEQLGLGTRPSFSDHWAAHPDLASALWMCVPTSRQRLVEEPIVGGLDAGGGTWVALNRRSGVLARILIAPTADGQLGESASADLRAQRSDEGYVTRSGLCLEAAVHDSADAAVTTLHDQLERSLADSGKRMLPFYLLVADGTGVHLLSHDERSLEVRQLPAGESCLVSVRGVDSPSSPLTAPLKQALDAAPRPRGNPSSWDPWLREFAVCGDAQYADDTWLAHRSHVLQPPYLNTVDSGRHRRARSPQSAEWSEIEWTKSTSCTALAPDGVELFMAEERHLDEGSPWPEIPSRMGFPSGADDYELVVAPARSHG